jgi:beta-glucosidase
MDPVAGRVGGTPRGGAVRVAAVLAVVAALLAAAAPAGAQTYRDAAAPVEARVQDLLARMTPAEKFWQLFMLAGAFDGDAARFEHAPFGLQVPAEPAGDPVARLNALQRRFVEDTRLGIPAIFFGEALHGLVQSGATVYPQALGLAATFDTTLVGEVAAAIAQDCRARGVRQVLSPVVNLARDPRWGRTEETYGEDPLLAGAMGAAFTGAFEHRGVVTTPKHWLANVGDGGRDSWPIDLSERALRETYLPPFVACLRAGGARSLMTAYNSLDGVPCSANAWLNLALLKGELGFTGFVISDAGAVGGANALHLTAGGYAEAAAQALAGGLDVIFQTDFAHHELFSPPFLDGTIPAARIDDAVARVLRVKFQLGLFEQPYVDPAASAAPDTAAQRALACRAARASLVLLKNEGGALPLRADARTIAVLGPDAAVARLGGYSASSPRAVSLLQGIRERAGAAVTVLHAPGCPRTEAAFVAVPPSALPGGLRAEYFANVDLAGEPAVARMDPQVDFRWTLDSPEPARLPRDFYSVRWQGTLAAPVTGPARLGVEGDDGWRLFLSDRLLIDNWTPTSRRTVTAPVTLQAGERTSLRLEFRAPTGNAQVRLVWDAGAAPVGDRELDEAVTVASRADVTVIAVGLEEGEFRDRASLALPGRQEELITRVAALGKPVVVVVVGGSAVTMSRWLDDVAAVLLAWYPGQEGGRALTDVLFGDADPGGRLPLSFPLAEGQLPAPYDHRPTGRGDDYWDLPGLPRFPFGFGLSYTTYIYSDLRLEPAVIRPGGSAVVRATVRNAGARAGDEIVQLYVHDELASVSRPVQGLAGFERLHLAPGESREVRFVLGPDQLALLDRDLRPRVEPGAFRVMVGASARDLRLRGVLTVRE